MAKHRLASGTHPRGNMERAADCDRRRSKCARRKVLKDDGGWQRWQLDFGVTYLTSGNLPETARHVCAPVARGAPAARRSHEYLRRRLSRRNFTSTPLLAMIKPPSARPPAFVDFPDHVHTASSASTEHAFSAWQARKRLESSGLKESCWYVELAPVRVVGSTIESGVTGSLVHSMWESTRVESIVDTGHGSRIRKG
jgi:hypothetical protein